jgi:hypothetical protein
MPHDRLVSTQPPSAENPSDPAAWLEQLRRGSGLQVDRQGRLLHDGEPVRHDGVRQTLLAGLDVDDAGEAVVRLHLADGRQQWAYVRCEDTPFVAEAARMTGSCLHLRLNTGERLSIPLHTLALRLQGDHDLLVAIHDGRHEARLGRAAWTAVADRLAWQGDRLTLQDNAGSVAGGHEAA